jgi:cytochrome oxidase assembly protein ShyY1
VYSFLFTPRWIVRHVIVVVVCGLCCLAGFWQIHRLHERQGHNRTVRHAMAEQPVDLDRTQNAVPYRRVAATGRYDVSNEILLRSQVLNDNSGNDLLTPLVGSDGRAVLVDRGWVSLDVTRPRERTTAPVATQVRIEGLVLPAERKRIFSPDIPPRGKVDAVNYVNVKRIGKQLPYALSLDGFVLLEEQRPANKQPLYEAPPELTDGPHRGYAVQWFLFMLVGIVGYSAFIRRELKRKGPPA